MDLSTTVGNDTNDNLLPSVLAPRSRLHTGAEVADVLHDTVHGPGKVDLVLIVHGDTDE